MALEKTGLQAVFLTDEFEKGLNTYMRGLAQVDKATTGTQQQTVAGAQKFASFAGAAGAAATGGVGALAVAAGSLLAKGLEKVATAAFDAVNAVVEFGASSLATAGRVDELTRVALLLGQNTGRTQSEVQGFLDNLADLGIRADVSAKLIAQLSRRNLDLAGATDLANVAQNAAVLVGADSSETLDRLVLGITTYNSRILRTAGLNVNMTQAQEALAAELGTTRDALNETEKIQAAYNAVLSEGEAIAGVYAVAQESPTKALRSLGRQVFNLQAALGAPFLDAWNSVINIARKFVDALTDAVQEGGALFPVLVDLGALASIAADGLETLALSFFDVLFAADQATEGIEEDVVSLGRTMTRVGEEAGGGFLESIVSSLVDTAEAALNWGIEISGALAEGLVRGAEVALNAAMTAIEGLFAFWLAPGSPPRVAPQIGVWGAEAFTEYLRGFAEADFNVLENLQGILGQFLELPEFQAITIDIGAAIAEGPTEEFFEKIRLAAGDFGSEVEALARNFFDLAEATTAAEEAQKALNAALEAVGDAGENVQALTDEYNRLLRAGASDAVLRAQLAQINAAEEQLSLAQKQAHQAEEAEEQARLHAEAVGEQTEAQEELVNQLLTLAEEEERTAEARATAGVEAGAARAGARGPAAQAAVGFGTALGEGITTGIGDAIERAKGMLLDRLGDMFAPLRERWDKSIKPAIDRIVKRFIKFRDNITAAWARIVETVQPFIDSIVEWLGTNIPLAIEETRRILEDDLLPIFEDVRDFVENHLIPVLRTFSDVVLASIRLASLAIARVWAERMLPAFRDVWRFISQNLQPVFESLGNFFTNVLGPALDAFRRNVVDKLVAGFQAWKSVLDNVNTILSIILGTINAIIAGLQEIAPGPGPGPEPDVPPLVGDVPVTVPAAAPSPMGAFGAMSSIINNSFNFGGNTIASRMDEATFDARVLRIVRRELGA